MNSPRTSPWALAGVTPALPVRATAPVDASACPTLVHTSSAGAAAMALAVPWTGPEVRLPARATSLTALALGPVVPLPRPDADATGIDASTVRT